MPKAIALTLIIVALAIGPQAALAQNRRPEGCRRCERAGKAAIVAIAEVTATVVAIDKITRTVTLKGPQRTVDVVAGDEVKTDQIHVGDRVVVRYQRALTRT